MVVLVGGPGVFRDGAFEGEELARLHAVDVFRHGAVGIHFDKEVEEAFVAWEERC